MKESFELEYYDEVANWNFDEFEIETEDLTNWDLFEELKKAVSKNSRILDLGTGGGEKLLKYFPDCKEIIGTDLSKEMIKTAQANLKKSGRKNITFRVMDNLEMDVPDDYFDVVVARHTVTDPKQILKCLKKGGVFLIEGVDKYDCHSLKYLFGKGQGYFDSKPISIIDYENVLDAGFGDVELIPLYMREYFKNRDLFLKFLKKVPILDDFSEMEENKVPHSEDINEELLDKYISENTVHGKIFLPRVLYGIIARKK